MSTLRIYPSAHERRAWEATGGLSELITPAVDDNRSLAGWIIKDLPTRERRGKKNVLNYRDPGSRDDAVRTAKAPRGGATSSVATSSPVAEWKTRISMSGTIAGYSFRKREPCISDVKRSTTNRRVRWEERSLTVIYSRNSRILHKRLVKREKERLECLDGFVPQDPA